MSFKERFSEYLKENDITQTDAAKLMGTTQQALSQLLRQSRKDSSVYPSTKKRIFEAFPDFAIYINKKDSYFELAKTAAQNFDRMLKNPVFKKKVEGYCSTRSNLKSQPQNKGPTYQNPPP